MKKFDWRTAVIVFLVLSVLVTILIVIINSPPPQKQPQVAVPPVKMMSVPEPPCPCDASSNGPWLYCGSRAGMLGSYIHLWSTAECGSTTNGFHVIEGAQVCMYSDVGEVYETPNISAFVGCMTGPNNVLLPLCSCVDYDGDGDVDLRDYQRFQVNPSHDGDS